MNLFRKVAIFVVLVLPGLPINSFACAFLPTPEMAAEASDVVFLGTAGAISDENSEMKFTVFEVEESFKGNLSTSVKVNSGFTAGERYLIYGKRHSGDYFSAYNSGNCSKTGPYPTKTIELFASIVDGITFGATSGNLLGIHAVREKRILRKWRES